MVNKIDAKGLGCPQPVVLTKKALDGIEEGTVEVTVDNKPASENVARFARGAGCEVQITEDSGQFRVSIEKKKAETETSNEQGKQLAVFAGSDTMGRGNEDLGKVLIRAFFPTLLETKPRPNSIIFMNAGVKLTVEGSEVLDQLKKLEQAGIELLVCGTCLEFYRIKGKISAGRISNMFEIVSCLLKSDAVVTI
jgi:selenium metabolism protein YedF